MLKYNLTRVCFFFGTILMVTGLSSCKSNDETEWRQLFNGENLEGWDIKIRGYELNDNFNNTFRVENGILKVSYDEYDDFGDSFGHLFFNEEFSNYNLRVEYRFTGEQASGGAAWAFRNNGIMFHSQSASSMGLDQDFPISIEAQLLGGSGTGERPNFSVCTPGTHVSVDGELRTDHCITSNGKTYDGDQWVTVELHVRGDSIVHHIIEADTVLTYTNLLTGGGNVSGYDPLVKTEGQPLKSGFISIQAESHPTEFRVIEILDLGF